MSDQKTKLARLLARDEDKFSEISYEDWCDRAVHGEAKAKAEAQYQVGRYLLKRHLLKLEPPNDPATGKFSLKEAARNGHAKACELLAAWWEDEGDQEKADEYWRQAVEHFREMAEREGIEGKREMALYCIEGRGGVERSPLQAGAWLWKAIDAGDEDAYTWLVEALQDEKGE